MDDDTIFNIHAIRRWCDDFFAGEKHGFKEISANNDENEKKGSFTCTFDQTKSKYELISFYVVSGEKINTRRGEIVTQANVTFTIPNADRAYKLVMKYPDYSFDSRSAFVELLKFQCVWGPGEQDKFERKKKRIRKCRELIQGSTIKDDVQRFANVIAMRFRNEKCLGDLDEYAMFNSLSDIIRPAFLEALKTQTHLSALEEARPSDAHIWTTIDRLASILKKHVD